jgi:hypothetical protein
MNSAQHATTLCLQLCSVVNPRSNPGVFWIKDTNNKFKYL